ncbi:Phage protein [plant metagenome]|uniref:Phage protein n=1 Tax=plant metagenome TaxID=1297885 RepID=A0A484VCW8_9ZZZZ
MALDLARLALGFAAQPAATPAAVQEQDAPSDDELLNLAMYIAHERELDVTGHPHDTDGAVRRFNAAVARHGAQPAASAEPWRASDADVLAWAERHLVENTLKGAAARCAIDDARSMHMLAAPVATQAQPEEVRDALVDSRYLAGVTAGWNAAHADDPNAAIKAIHDAHDGYLKPLRDWQKAGKPAVAQAQSSGNAGELPTLTMHAAFVRHFGHDRNWLNTEGSYFVEGYRAALAAQASGQAQDALTQAAQDVLAERQRQISVEGWTPEHDDKYTAGDMASAAACYASQGRYHYPEPGKPGPNWPWAPAWWKPAGYRSNLIKAGALVLAEIERLDRDAARQESKGGGHV